MLSGKAITLAGQTSVRYSSGRLKELGIRLKSVTSIQKITKTMQMISAAKYARAAKELENARAFGVAGAGCIDAMSKAEGFKPLGGEHLVIVCSSDRGLCGALHTNTARAAAEVAREKDDVKYVVLGEKCRVSLKSMGEDNKFLITAKDIGRNNPTFGDAAEVAQAILTSGYDWKAGTLVFNHHASAMKQEINEQSVASQAGLEAMPGIELYDSVDEDVIQKFAEFALASTIYSKIRENFASEQAARMVSMDGATKNAGDMIEKMNLSYNRMRQAIITTELCEIIAGMSAI